MADTGEKYRDKVDPVFKMAMELVTSSYHTMKMIEGELRKVDEAERQSHSIGHILNPTLYRDQIHSKNFEQTMKVVRAALAFIEALDKAKDETT